MDSLQHTPRNTVSQRLHRQPGFTLVEAAVTLAILAALACGAAPSFHGMIERQRLAGLASQLATDVQFVRSESVLRNEALRLSFYSAVWGTCYVVHSGVRNQCSCTTASIEATCVADAAQIKTVIVPASAGASVQANVSSILFDPLHGTSTPTGTLRVVSPAVGSIHHVVNVLGRVRTCSPDGPVPALPGYRVC
ncbi:MAG: GspH/FimT family pseudopilin [Burkholderiaceae bacterium]|nr:GspH/FimT family pseudopilin [Burkholderiaceae bacterium]